MDSCAAKSPSSAANTRFHSQTDWTRSACRREGCLGDYLYPNPVDPFDTSSFAL
jgi:hypothetical protein